MNAVQITTFYIELLNLTLKTKPSIILFLQAVIKCSTFDKALITNHHHHISRPMANRLQSTLILVYHYVSVHQSTTILL